MDPGVTDVTFVLCVVGSTSTLRLGYNANALTNHS